MINNNQSIPSFRESNSSSTNINSEDDIIIHQPIQVVSPDPCPLAQPIRMVETDSNGIRLYEWDAGFWDCFKHCIPNGCMVWCFPCITMAQISVRLRLYSYTIVLVAYGILYILLSSLLFHGIFWFQEYHWHLSVALFLHMLCAMFVWMFRHHVRKRFLIKGEIFKDVFASFLCSMCTMAQIASHLKSYKPGNCEFSSPSPLRLESQAENQSNSETH